MDRSEGTGVRWKQWPIRWVWTAVLSATVSWAGMAQASLVEFYIGVDRQETISSGTYAGLSNPNFGRLTFLFAHPDETNPANSHYHGIGAWSYSGPAASPTVNNTNTNNRIPETFTNQAPLPLFPGQGAEASKWVSQAVPGLEYSDLQWESTQSLSSASPGTLEHFLFTSSGNRWAGALDNTNVALELVEVTPGLQVADDTGTSILSTIGETYELGDGNLLSFQPGFFTMDDTEERYSAAFRLIDLNGTLKNSGTFHMDFAPVPLPAAAWLFGSGPIGLASLARRKMAASF
ncbi:MAG: VPLPA-CTERM sorting domain-containing protein [Nitrospira sp.]|nr:VPLPA-CTERM sorting domain-containing protein [Nitrospira sp.]